MMNAEKRINIILTNYARGRYTLAYLKDILARGLQHVEERGVMGVDKQFIVNLCHIEAAIKRIEQAQNRNH